MQHTCEPVDMLIHELILLLGSIRRKSVDLLTTMMNQNTYTVFFHIDCITFVSLYGNKSEVRSIIVYSSTSRSYIVFSSCIESVTVESI